METEKTILIALLRDLTKKQTVTSLAEELGLSRVGVWKVLRKLNTKKYILIEPVGTGKTSTFLIKLNWNNILVEKTLTLYLTEESVKQRRWRTNFAELEKKTDFLIIFGGIITSPQQANDIDIIGIAKKNKFISIQKCLDLIQKTQSKKIHAINLTASELQRELQKKNKAILEAIKKGIILLGQDNFIKFMKSFLINT